MQTKVKIQKKENKNMQKVQRKFKKKLSKKRESAVQRQTKHDLQRTEASDWNKMARRSGGGEFEERRVPEQRSIREVQREVGQGRSARENLQSVLRRTEKLFGRKRQSEGQIGRKHFETTSGPADYFGGQTDPSTVGYSPRNGVL